MNQSLANLTIPEFSDETLIKTALTHRSSLNESGNKISNERLEFLGDAVLELVTTQYLYDRFPTKPEGVLTMYRSALVKTETLAMVASKMKLGDALIMSKGEEASGGRLNKGLLADTFEAITGALYLDQGYDAARNFLETVLLIHTDDILEKGLHKDPKSSLQEKVQALGFETPYYKVLEESGPDHDKKFTVAVMIDSKAVAEGSGKSKQEAQQKAAENALAQYKSP